jgi:cell division protein FtsL
MRWPLANISVAQEFGSTAVDYSQFGLKGHHGIDLNASIGTPVYAPESGTILQSANGVTDPKSGRFAAGETIVMQGTYEHWLMHLNQRLVSAGQKVTEGQLIGYTGNTGFTTGPHLHAGTRPLNPDMDNGYRGFVNPRNVIVSTPSAGGNMFQTDQEVQEAYLMLRGNPGSAAERAGWIGQSKQRFFQVAKPEADATRTALANLQKDVAAKNTQISTLTTKVTSLENQVKSLTAQTTTLTEQIKALTNTISAKDKEIADLKAQVGDNSKWETLKALVRELVGR